MLAEVVAQLKQVGKVQEDVEGLKQAQAHTAQGLTYLATVRHHPCTLCLIILTHSPYKSCLVTDRSVYCDNRTVVAVFGADIIFRSGENLRGNCTHATDAAIASDCFRSAASRN